MDSSGADGYSDDSFSWKCPDKTPSQSNRLSQYAFYSQQPRLVSEIAIVTILTTRSLLAEIRVLASRTISLPASVTMRTDHSAVNRCQCHRIEKLKRDNLIGRRDLSQNETFRRFIYARTSAASHPGGGAFFHSDLSAIELVIAYAVGRTKLEFPSASLYIASQDIASSGWDRIRQNAVRDLLQECGM